MQRATERRPPGRGRPESAPTALLTRRHVFPLFLLLAVLAPAACGGGDRDGDHAPGRPKAVLEDLSTSLVIDPDGYFGDLCVDGHGCFNGGETTPAPVPLALTPGRHRIFSNYNTSLIAS